MGLRVSKRMEDSFMRLVAENGGVVGNTAKLPDEDTVAPARHGPTRHELFIPGWTPTSINTLLATSPFKRGRLKKLDVELVIGMRLQEKIPIATGKRKVSALFTTQRGTGDADNFLKVLFDALVAAKLLIDDAPRWCVHGEFKVVKGKKSTLIVLEDIPELPDEPITPQPD